MNILPQGPAGLGELIGQGLSDVVGQWTQHRSTKKALKGLGFSDAEAQSYSHLGPQVTQQAIQARQQQQQQMASNAAINQILNAGLGGDQYQQPMQSYQQASTQQSPTSIPKRQLPHEQQQAAIQQATGIAQNPAYRKLQEQQQGAQALQQQQLAQQFGPQSNQPTPEQQAIRQAQAIEAQKSQPSSIKQQIEQVRNQKRALAAAGLPANQAIALHGQLEAKEKELRREAREERKEALEEKKLSAAEQRLVDKETLPTYKDINDKAKAAKDSDLRLNRIERLLDKGKVQDNVFIRALGSLKENRYIGEIAGALGTIISNKDTQEFEKLSTDFVRDAKQFFGSRITDNEVKLFLKTVPSLSQTNEGKKRVIRNMRIFNEAAELKQKAMNDIIRYNGGKRPANLEALIEDRIGSDLDRLKNEFTEGATIESGGILPRLL